MTRSLSLRTLRMRPVFPLSSPAITITWSFLRKCFMAPLDHFRSEGDDLHELPLAQLARHGAEDAGSLGLLLVVDEDGRVLVEPDVAPVPAADLLHGADEHRLVDVPLLHGGSRQRVLDGDDDHVAEPSVPLAGPAEDL